MSKNIGTSEKKSRRSSAKSFFFGGFIGFLSCILLIVGVGLFSYYVISPKWINKTFKTNIDLGSEEANSKTLKDFIAGAVGIVKNADTYTLNDLKKDFGIGFKDEFFGIEIKDLKDVSLSNLGSAVQNKFSSISAQELRNVKNMDFENLSHILDKTTTYYFDDVECKLYGELKEGEFDKEATFDYSISADKSKVKIKSYEFAIVDKKVEIELWYLPLVTSINRFTINLGEQLTLGELEKEYGVDLPDFFDNIDRTTPINSLETEINLLNLSDFLGYKLNGEIVYEDINENEQYDVGEEITGIMAKLAKLKVQELENVKSTIIDMSTVAEIMGYYKDEDVYYTDKACTIPVTGVMRVAAGKKISELSTLVDDLYLSDVFDPSDFNSGSLSILKGKENTKVVDMATTLSDVLNDLTVNELHTSGIISLTETQLNKLDNEIIPGSGKTLGEMKIMDIIISYINAV